MLRSTKWKNFTHLNAALDLLGTHLNLHGIGALSVLANIGFAWMCPFHIPHLHPYVFVGGLLELVLVRLHALYLVTVHDAEGLVLLIKRDAFAHLNWEGFPDATG